MSIFELSERLLSPPSSPNDSDHHSNPMGDQRALEKLALELSMLDLTGNGDGLNHNSADIAAALMNIQQQQQQLSHLSAMENSNGQHSPADGLVAGSTLNAFTSMLGFSPVSGHFDDRSKKSQNMTECVPVPSSEHVAEIVGRQGCKIKALRAKTNTYIKTPVRGEEPVFVVTGRKEDVAKAKREILSAAEHFSLIRASRKPSLLGGLTGKGTPPGPPSNIPGQITILVRVPYRVVGLVVGPKGATIKHIQQQTQTYIVTPSRDKEPVFEVTGMPDNVQSARRQIEAHIVLRTGSAAGSNGALNEMGSNVNLSGSQDFLSSPLLSSLYKNGLSSLLEHFELKEQDNQFGGQAAQMTSSTGSSTCSSNSSTSSKSASMQIRPELIDLWKTMGNENSLDCDEGISDSPINIWSLPNATSLVGSRTSPTASASPTDSLLTTGTQSKSKRDCYYCGEKEANSLLVPCGHQIFCVDCSERVCDAQEACPVCNQKPTQSMKILA